MGDFNSLPTSLPMQLLLNHANLTDAWATTRPTPPPTSPLRRNTLVNATEAMETWGLTADSPLNTWSHSKPLDAVARKWLGKRLDYILFRSPLPHAGPSLSVQETKIVMTGRVPGYDFSFSDHFGLEATFTIVQPPDQSNPANTTLNVPANRTAVQIEDRLAKAPTEMPEEALLTAIGALTFEYRDSYTRTRRHIAYLAICVAVLMLILVGSAWVPAGPWVAPIAALLSGVVTWGGTTALYVGFVFGKWERNMLVNIIEEMETLRRTVHRHDPPRTPGGEHVML